MAPPTLGLHAGCENIIIKRRRKRLLPLDFVLPDEGRLIDLSPISDGIREAYPLPGDGLTREGCVGESSPILSQICSHSELALPTPTIHGGQPITVHDFLQDISASSKAGRKYGRRNRLATVKLDAYYHSEDCRSRSRSLSPTPITPSSWSVETRNEHHSFAYPRIQYKRKRLSRRVPHPRRKKQLAKSLAQRLFEADVFSSGTSYRPMSDRDPAHTSSRRPLQFITSLNLSQSPESSSRTCETRWARHGRTRKSLTSAAADPEIRQADGSASGTLPSNRLALATGGGKPSSRSLNEAATQRTRTGAPAAAGLTSRKRAFRMRGGKLSAAQLRPSPFEYVPLPLMRVELAPRIRSYANDPQYRSGCTGWARMRRCQTNFN